MARALVASSHSGFEVQMRSSITAIIAGLVAASAVLAQAPSALKPHLMAQSGHAGEIYAVAVSRDGSLIATAGSDESAIVWDVATGREAWRFDVPGQSWDLAFDPAGKHLAVSASGTYVFDLSAGTKRWASAGGLAVAFSTDGNILLSADGTGTVHRLNAATGETLLPPIPPKSADAFDRVKAITVDPVRPAFAATTLGNRVRFIHMVTGEPIGN